MRLLTDILRDIRRGRLVEAATGKLNELVTAVQKARKAGELTLILKVEPDKTDEDAVRVVAKVKVKLPEGDAGEVDGLFFINPEGDLVRDDPRQNEMFREAGEVRGREPMTG